MYFFQRLLFLSDFLYDSFDSFSRMFQKYFNTAKFRNQLKMMASTLLWIFTFDKLWHSFKNMPFKFLFIKAMEELSKIRYKDCIFKFFLICPWSFGRFFYIHLDLIDWGRESEKPGWVEAKIGFYWWGCIGWERIDVLEKYIRLHKLNHWIIINWWKFYLVYIL